MTLGKITTEINTKENINVFFFCYLIKKKTT